MTQLRISNSGQVILQNDVLQHFGLGPGDVLELDFLPDGRAVLQAATPQAAVVSNHTSTSIPSFFGLLASKTDKVATIEEIDAACQQGWAGEP